VGRHSIVIQGGVDDQSLGPSVTEPVLANAIEAMLADPRPVYNGRSPGEVLDACVKMRAALERLYERVEYALIQRCGIEDTLRALDEEASITAEMAEPFGSSEYALRHFRDQFRVHRQRDHEASFEEVLARAADDWRRT
jgi:hypothetical protein